MSASETRPVLVTRPEPGASDTAKRISMLGFEPVLAPCLQIRKLPVNLPPSSSVQAMLVTSGNAADTLPRSHRALPLLAVGDATTARAGEAGFTDLRSAGGDARDLAELASRVLDPAGPALLLACGAGDGREVAAALRGRGFRVQRRIVYAAEPIPSLPPVAVEVMRAGHLHAATFFSTATARHFVRLVTEAGLTRALARTLALAISPAVALALEGLPWRNVQSAARPTQDELLALLT